MNWEIIAAVAELLGALGVIGSLVYVAYQVKDSARATRIESKLRVTGMLVDFGDKLLDDPNLSRIMLEGRKRSLATPLNRLSARFIWMNFLSVIPAVNPEKMLMNLRE
ncbi:MAG: hypothetical protein OXU66_05980 [Gammaproteobacteria bacterium]|nr:hypothetical protein [Gammaproteobacteria bacterium]MDD9895541.1 hypothetical protein [Gammaproteobacteria bacterium]MDD9958473.1 hypothetical protein [Gammaproteobacteria bacterium]